MPEFPIDRMGAGTLDFPNDLGKLHGGSSLNREMNVVIRSSDRMHRDAVPIGTLTNQPVNIGFEFASDVWIPAVSGPDDMIEEAPEWHTSPFILPSRPHCTLREL
jgi:hypothetical protein